MTLQDERFAIEGRRFKILLTGLAVAGLVLFAAGCGEQEAPAPEAEKAAGAALTPAEEFARSIENAHGLQAWRSRSALETDIVVEFGGNKMIDGKMLVETSGGRSRMELQDNLTLVWDGQDAWISPADASFPQARFHVRTWPYFLAAPMKLRDPGANLELTGTAEILDKTCTTARLTFDEGVGDTPDDWYVVYQDSGTGRLAGLAYIVTYGKSAEEAGKEPHAVTYDNFTAVDGVTLSTEWTFWLWNEEQGPHGDPLGKVTLSNPRFVTPPPGAFTKPEDAKKDELPQP